MTAHISRSVLVSPLGRLGIHIEKGALKTLRYLGVPAKAEKSARRKRFSGQENDELLREVEYQLHCYFKDPRWRFDLPIAPDGTTFQRRVWKAVGRIPSGEVMTYGHAARRLDSGARAIGGACRNNPLPIIIPCHRVVAAGGAGGYCGTMQGKFLRAKQWLLRHEGYREDGRTE